MVIGQQQRWMRMPRYSKMSHTKLAHNAKNDDYYYKVGQLVHSANTKKDDKDKTRNDDIFCLNFLFPPVYLIYNISILFSCC